MIGESDEVVISTADRQDFHVVQSLWLEYWNSVGLAPDFQNFADEVRSLPGHYALPNGRLLLARVGGTPAGTVALRPLNERCCEAKRLYVRPEFRGKGVGRALLTELIKEARSAGYKELYATVRTIASKTILVLNLQLHGTKKPQATLNSHLTGKPTFTAVGFVN